MRAGTLLTVLDVFISGGGDASRLGPHPSGAPARRRQGAVTDW
jgi:hypothetical protein